MSDKHLAVSIEHQVDQSRMIKKLEAENSRLRSLLRETSCLACEKHNVLYQPKNGCSLCEIDRLRSLLVPAEVLEESADCLESGDYDEEHAKTLRAYAAAMKMNQSTKGNT